MEKVMDPNDVVLSHPHDFFRFKHLPVEIGTCFVLMPFSPDSELVYETIKEALSGLMVCKRADDLRLGQPILERILRGIATAELIVADLTGRNPNVFYELALAHTKTKSVLLLTRDINDVPFDLRSLFCHRYTLDSQASLRALADVVRNSAIEVQARKIPRALETALIRTQRIVDYMSNLLRRPDDCRSLLIRAQASISSLGNLGRADAQDPETRRYGNLLEEERELLIQLVEKGAQLHVILSPNRVFVDAQEGQDERSVRISRVISFLNRADNAIDRCEFVISPVSGPNLLFFGDQILFEGHKTQVGRGFGWTLVYTESHLLHSRLAIFDRLLESARQFTLDRFGDTRMGGGDGDVGLRTAVLHALEEARSGTLDFRGQNQGDVANLVRVDS